MASIKFEHVSKSFGKTKVIQGLELDIRHGEFLVLVGPSGCGKSTILRMIAGLEEPTEGNIFINSRLVNKIPPKDRDVAIVFQNYALYPHMTAYENMAFGLKIRGGDKKIIQSKVMEAAKILDLEPLLQRKPGSMSGGQLQRVAIGRAIVRNPGVFLFDEPLSNLDAKLRGQMRIEIARLHKTLATTVVYVTHDQVEAMTLGHRIAVMYQGVIQQLDTPDQVYHYPANLFVAGFIGSPPMNFLEGHVQQEGNGFYFRHAAGTLELGNYFNDFSDQLTGRPLVLGIRPEHLEPSIETPGKEDSLVFEARVTLVENLGHEQIVHCVIGDIPISALLKNQPGRIAPAGPIRLRTAPESLCFFEKESGSRISFK